MQQLQETAEKTGSFQRLCEHTRLFLLSLVVAMQDETRDVPLDQIVEPWLILRAVARGSVEYLELRDSLAEKGFYNSICVRPSPRVADKFEVVDGLYRFTAARELRLASAPCIIKYNLTDTDVLSVQIQANVLRPETTPVEYARQLRKLMDALSISLKKDATLADVSVRVHKNPEWIAKQLLLLELVDVAQKAVERGEIPLVSAQALARLPKGRQRQYLDLARTLPGIEFVPIAIAFVKKFRESVRKGKLDDLYAEYEPVAYLRSRNEVLAEYNFCRLGATHLAAAKCTTVVRAWELALQWSLHLDPASIQEQRERVARRRQTAVLAQDEEDNQ